jgi:hypothetical protein
MARYIVGTDDGQVATEPYSDEDHLWIFTSLDAARDEAAGLNQTGWIPAPGGGIILGRHWKVYVLTEVWSETPDLS